MEDPVVAADGHTYERRNILRWLQHSIHSPTTDHVRGWVAGCRRSPLRTPLLLPLPLPLLALALMSALLA